MNVSVNQLELLLIIHTVHIVNLGGDSGYLSSVTVKLSIPCIFV